MLIGWSKSEAYKTTRVEIVKIFGKKIQTNKITSQKNNRRRTSDRAVPFGTTDSTTDITDRILEIYLTLHTLLMIAKDAIKYGRCLGRCGGGG
jgi:hypothetical protein